MFVPCESLEMYQHLAYFSPSVTFLSMFKALDVLTFRPCQGMESLGLKTPPDITWKSQFYASRRQSNWVWIGRHYCTFWANLFLTLLKPNVAQRCLGVDKYRSIYSWYAVAVSVPGNTFGSSFVLNLAYPHAICIGDIHSPPCPTSMKQFDGQHSSARMNDRITNVS